jgi:DNA-binding response OmpR family regulator
MARLLVVEDDPRMAQELVRVLRDAGYDLELRGTAAGLIDEAASGRHEAVLLDLSLPDADGLDLLPALRARCSAPVLVVSARLDVRSRVESFKLGAIDFIAKPFFMEELLARLDARLGRPLRAPAVAVIGEARLDLQRRRVTVDDADVGLTQGEFSLLVALYEQRPRPVSRSYLARVALPAADTTERTVDSHVVRLRAKLKASGALIKTVWRVGYQLDLGEAGKTGEAES